MASDARIRVGGNLVDRVIAEPNAHQSLRSVRIEAFVPISGDDLLAQLIPLPGPNDGRPGLALGVCSTAAAERLVPPVPVGATPPQAAGRERRQGSWSCATTHPQSPLRPASYCAGLKLTSPQRPASPRAGDASRSPSELHMATLPRRARASEIGLGYARPRRRRMMSVTGGVDAQRIQPRSPPLPAAALSQWRDRPA